MLGFSDTAERVWSTRLGAFSLSPLNGTPTVTIRFAIFGVELATLTIELDPSPAPDVEPEKRSRRDKARKTLAMALIK